jgi:serine/threonine protein kinase/Tol biopolymer transport system component
MGEVYRARDKRLERTVAIKILPAQFSNDPVRKQRFEREARTISGLNHPNICVLHDVGSQDGVDYLVMECLDGGTLAKRLEKGPLPLEQALRYGAQIADGLDKAHRNGIVHRDLKPGNIMLTATGAKLLDFGLAKPAVPLTSVVTLTAAGTQDSPVTERGTIVGTFQYMSPEQVEGKELDGRSDIFSLGAVLYEMLTGKRAFEGKSQLSVASAILEKEPAPISSVKPMTPPTVDHAVKKCLTKLADERWQSASDLASELRWIAEGATQSGVSTPIAGRASNRQRLAWSLAAVFAVTSVAGLIAYLRRLDSPTLDIIADVSPPEGAQFDFLNGGPPALSPDGRALVFAARGKTGSTLLWVRALDGTAAQPLPGTEESAGPFWSPDGRRIGFLRHNSLQVIDTSGGHSVILSDAATRGAGSWSRDGTILFLGDEGIYQVAASGGAATLVVRVDSSKYSFYLQPRFMPDGKHFIYGATRNPGSADMYFASLDGKENRPLLEAGGARGVYASGFLLYCRGTTLMAQPFDPERGQLNGTARPIAQQVRQGTYSNGFFDTSPDDVLVYQPARGPATQTQLAWFDRGGRRLALIAEPAVHFDPRLSRDGLRLASSVGAGNSEIWVDDLGRSVRMRLTFDPDTDKGIPVWSPDGSRILYSTLRGGKAPLGIFQKASNGTGGPEPLLPSGKPDREAWATDWSPDGRFVLFSRGGMANNVDADIWVLPLFGERKPSLFIHTAASAYEGQFSPDGRWVAYTSSESGRPEVYVVPFEAAKFLAGGRTNSTPAGKWQISSNGGSVPRWRRDGKELFYLSLDNTMMAVEVEGKGSSFQLARAQPLFVAPINPFSLTYDASPDGKRFVISFVPEEENLPLVLMSSWTARLQGK